jgi:hypothetical protein
LEIAEALTPTTVLVSQFKKLSFNRFGQQRGPHHEGGGAPRGAQFRYKRSVDGLDEADYY